MEFIHGRFPSDLPAPNKFKVPSNLCAHCEKPVRHDEPFSYSGGVIAHGSCVESLWPKNKKRKKDEDVIIPASEKAQLIVGITNRKRPDS